MTSFPGVAQIGDAELLASDSEDSGDPDWAAMMTTRQFAALKEWIDTNRLQDELAALPSPSSDRMRGDSSVAEVAQWLRNGWSTERLLRWNLEVYPGPEKAFALHWAFPQTYYSAYAVATAFLRARGTGESTHSSVIRRIGEDMLDGHYPPVISFLATGGPYDITYANIQKHPGSCSLEYRRGDVVTAENQIAQFLCGTRKLDLKMQKVNMKLRTSRGKLKKNFSKADWHDASRKLGPTSIFSLLYRYRIRANYGDIDMLLSEDLECETVFESLVHIAHSLNFVHEAKMMQKLGSKRFEQVLAAAGAEDHDFVGTRLCAWGSLGCAQ